MPKFTVYAVGILLVEKPRETVFSKKFYQALMVKNSKKLGEIFRTTIKKGIQAQSSNTLECKIYLY